MELVYLWVEEYKNIKKQGFNFSPRFHCEYNEESNELTIEENDDYIPDFFGKNINVTAIIGKNGSGKSSVFEVLNSIILNNLNEKKFILIYKKNDIKLFHSNFSFKTDLTYINNYQDIKHYIYSNEVLNIKNQILLEKEDIIKKIIENEFEYEEFNLSSFMYLPNQIEIISINLNKLLDNYDYIDDFGIPLPDFILKFLSSNMTFSIGKGSLKLEDIKKIDNDYYKFLICKYIESYAIPMSYDRNILDILDFDEKNIISEDEFYEYFHNKNILKPMHELSLNEKKYIKEYSYFFHFDFIDKKNRKYNHLSHGEKMIFGQLFNIYFFLMNESIDNLLFLFDEPEISLHPNWQQKYLNELVELLNNKRGNYHFIFTSHSPFLLSDIPKQNIIFLDKDEKGNCKVVDGLKEKKETFGANIHTLLSDSFFMEDGLMGEFAKSKIDDVINYLHDRESKIKSDDEAQKLIHIIGEPIVKNQLQRMLDSRRLKKVDRIDAIEKDIKALTEKLARLKND